MRTDAPFQLDFYLEGKAAVNEADDGFTYVEGYASDFGLDRQDEAFEPGAFAEGIKGFMQNPVVLYHHKFDQALGRVIEFDHRKDGLWVKAALDPAEPGTEAADIIRKVRTGTIKGFSVGGKFHRRVGPDGRARIYKADIAELSVTPLPINPRTLLQVAGKAFGDDEQPSPDLTALNERLDGIAEIFDSINERLTDAKAAMTHGSWDGSESRFTTEQYVRSCIIKGKGKSDSHLPVREPDGTLNCTAVSSALGRLNQVQGVSAEQKSAARSKLESLQKRCQSRGGSNS